ncbi:MAG: ABC transporter permease [Nitrososphaerales archaeon]
MVVQETIKKEKKEHLPAVSAQALTRRSLIENKWVIRAITFAVIVVGWQIAGAFTSPLFLPTPTSIVSAFFLLLGGTGQYSLIPATIVTMEQTLAGFLLGVVIGLPLGIVMGMFRKIDVALDPYVTGLYVTPRIALIPLIIIWFGTGFNAITVVALLLTVFPVIINTYAGVRDISRSMLDTSEVFGVKGMQRFRKVTFPGMIPFFMTGVRLGLGQAFIGVIVAQMLLSLQGLGYMLTAFGDYLDTADLWVLIIELMILGVILTLIVQVFEKRLAYWKISERAYQ